MNFELNEQQRQLQDSVQKLVRQHCSFEQRRAIAASPQGRSAELYAQLAELGITGLLVPEDHGGFGARMEDLLPVLQALGGALLTEPVLASAVLAATALRLSGDEPAQARWLPDIADGSMLLSWAHDEPGSGRADCWIETRAERQGSHWVLHGRKQPVLHGAQAQAFIVSARVAGAAGDMDGRALFVVEAAAGGLTRRDFRLVDDTPAAGLTLDGVVAQPLGDPLDGAAASAVIRGTADAGIAALCCDMLGAAEAAFKLAVDYLNVRRQFGRLIGENQALRHRAAEMLVSLETARSMAIAAVVAADHPHEPDSAADLLRAKLVVGRHARLVCQQAIQCHGGIGMTEEFAVGHCLRRVHVADQLFGDEETQAQRLAALL